MSNNISDTKNPLTVLSKLKYNGVCICKNVSNIETGKIDLKKSHINVLPEREGV